MTWESCQGLVKANHDKSMKKNTPISSKNKTNFLGEVIKLGLDVHMEKYVVAMKVDGSAPNRPKSFTPERFLGWVTGLKERCGQVFTCYEAGPFGYTLHRKLESLGIVNYVIRPVNWDEHGQKVKTDGRDATQMALCLDGYLRGNARSFSVVRVPTEQEERERSVTRQRKSLQRERQRIAAKARGHVVYYGGRLKGQWWKAGDGSNSRSDWTTF